MQHKLMSISKIIIIVVACLHLVLVPMHIGALLQMTNEICGFIMFLFVLSGLIALFNATRTKDLKGNKWIFSVIVLLLCIALGGYLLTLYIGALSTQDQINVLDMILGIILTVGVCISLLGSAVLLVWAKITK